MASHPHRSKAGIPARTAWSVTQDRNAHACAAARNSPLKALTTACAAVASRSAPQHHGKWWKGPAAALAGFNGQKSKQGIRSGFGQRDPQRTQPQRLERHRAWQACGRQQGLRVVLGIGHLQPDMVQPSQPRGNHAAAAVKPDAACGIRNGER